MQSDEDSEDESDDDEEDDHRPAPKAAPKPKRAANGTRKGKSTNGPAPKKQRKQAPAATNGDPVGEPQGEFKTDSAFFSMSYFPFLPT